MKIALAQIHSNAGDIEQNSAKHLRAIRQAAMEKADFILFPELSLIGYEPELAKGLAFEKDDAFLRMFQELSDELSIHIALGIPLKTGDKPEIALAFFSPKEAVHFYSKQILHEDEEPYFSSGKEQYIHRIALQSITPAICYESRMPEHTEAAHQMKADIYACSVAKPGRNYEAATDHYRTSAKKYGMTIAMANSIGPSDNFIACGKSAVWNNQGELVTTLGETEEELLIYSTESGSYQIQSLD